MNAIVLETVPCDLCNGSEFEEELIGIDWEFDGSEQYKVVKCKQCKLIQQNPRPNIDSIKYIYPRRYGFYDSGKATALFHRVVKSAFQRLKGNSIQYIHLNRIKKGKVLDVGCGTGSTLYPFGFTGSLKSLANDGWSAHGCEINQEAAESGTKSGLEIKVGRLTEVDYDDNYFDVVRFNHVLEHSVSPLVDLTKAKAILKPGGLLILSVPNINSAAYKLFGKYWSGLDLPRHYYFFTPDILEKYFTHLGLEVVSDSTDSIPDDFIHSLKHFLHSSLFNRNNLKCETNNKIVDIFNGRMKASGLLFALSPIIKFFNQNRLGDNYTVIAKKR